MTAIFAHVHDHILFIAGDTRRGTSFPLRVQKVHSWGDNIVLGQAGNGQTQSELIAELRVARNHSAMNTEAIFYGKYTQLRGKHVSKIHPPAQPNGTILVAALDPGASIPGLFTYNLPDGHREVVQDDIAAIGWERADLTVIATQRFTQLASQAPLSLDEWAQLCMRDAVLQFPEKNDWPCDLLIARPDGLGGRMIVERRIEDQSKVRHRAFTI